MWYNNVIVSRTSYGWRNQIDFEGGNFQWSNHFNIRPAQPEESGLVLEFIKKLAAYEKCADEVVADEATLRHSLFEERSAEVVFAEEDGVVIGFALFFHNFSTFVGRKGLYLEDLFILPEKRGKGYGKALLKYLAQLAVERQIYIFKRCHREFENCRSPGVL